MFTLTHHASGKVESSGFTVAEILDAANRPTLTYPNRKHPGQVRHIRGDVVTTVDPASQKIITFYRNVVETDLREDQTDADAKRYAARRGQKARLARKQK
jgi:hypothetical protein